MQHHVERSHCRSQWHCSVHRDESLAVPPGPHTSMARLARDLKLEEEKWRKHANLQFHATWGNSEVHIEVDWRFSLCRNYSHAGSGFVQQLLDNGSPLWGNSEKGCQSCSEHTKLIQIHPSSKSLQTHTYKTMNNYSCKQYLNILILESDTCLSALVQHISTLEPT